MLPGVAVDWATLRVEAPVGLPLSLASQPALQSSVQGDKRVWTVEGRFPASPLDDGASSLRRQIPHVQVSTLPSQQEFAKRFAQKMLERAVVTEQVRSLAQSLGVQAGTDEQKLRAVYDWVRREIKYVALYLGVGGWVPHDTAHILEKRYGDCKDHVLVMLALLQALGLDAQPALVNIYSDYGLDPVGMGFNHVVVYVPGLNKFLDPTDTFTPYERLPYAVYGKPTVVSDGHGARVVRTPVLAAQDNSVVSKSRFVIAADGSAQVQLQVAAQGYAASLVQSQLQQIPAGMGWAAVQRILKQSGERGKGNLSFDAVDRDRSTQSFEATAEIQGLLRNPESGATVLNPTLALPIYIHNNMGNYQQESRSLPYVCNSMRIREEFSLEFDPSFQLGRTPKPFKREIEGLRFEAQYQREGNRIDGWREILIEHPEQECSPQEYLRRRSTMLEIAQHLRTQVLYER
ncbi:MAG: transglutaminase-like domain-containing protein [Rhodoferax sp.]